MSRLRFIATLSLALIAGCGEHDWREIADQLSNGGGGKHHPGDADASVLCPAIAYETNGRCEAPPGCEKYDAEDCDGPLACTLILYPTNGTCEAAAGCLAQDPVDCAAEDVGTGQDAGAAQSCGSRGLGRCAEGEFCHYPPEVRCGQVDAPGTCQVPPTACTREYRPVCGCDGRTYENSCIAAAAEVSVQKEGPCDPPSDGGTDRSCGGYAGIQCAVSEFCDFPPTAQCGFGDQPGTCKPLPSCTINFDPVCGCDGRTYHDECQAHAAGVSVKHDGSCPPATDGGTASLCGGYAGLGCPADQFCDFPVETRCGSGDQAGTCSTKPEACTAEYDPVCGCDGRTYSNRCAAAREGVAVASEGAC